MRKLVALHATARVSWLAIIILLLVVVEGVVVIVRISSSNGGGGGGAGSFENTDWVYPKENICCLVGDHNQRDCAWPC